MKNPLPFFFLFLGASLFLVGLSLIVKKESVQDVAIIAEEASNETQKNKDGQSIQTEGKNKMSRLQNYRSRN